MSTNDKASTPAADGETTNEKVIETKTKDKAKDKVLLASPAPEHDEEIGLAPATPEKKTPVAAQQTNGIKQASIKNKDDGIIHEPDIERPLIGDTGATENPDASKAEGVQNNNKIGEIEPLTSTTTDSGSPPQTKGPANMMPNDFETFLDTFDREKEERVQALSEDIYSLIYTAEARSQAFCFAITIWLVQTAILWLILFDLVDLDSPDNKIRLPPGVPIMVSIAQAIGVLLIVFTIAVFGDLTRGLSRLTEGYDDAVLQDHPDAYRIKWFLSGFFQFAAGLAMTMDLFILMMQSTSVVGMCLNFAALHFVQEIDDMSFILGQKGFLTQAIQTECNHVTNPTVPKGKTTVRRWTRQIFIVALTIGLYAPYFILVNRQWSGEYVCSSLYIQFGDAYLPELAYFSGPFSLATKADGEFSKIAFRPYYIERTKTLKLAYCSKEKAWTFSLNNETYDCSNFIVKSSTSNTFDVTTLKDQTWYTWNTETNLTAPTDWFHLACNDCTEGATGTCAAEAGRCVDNTCVCNPGRMGVNCQFPAPDCDHLAIDERTEPLPLEEGVTFPEDYELYKRENGHPIQVHFHPVYISTQIKVGFENSTDFMFFTGRRWAIFADRTATTDPGDAVVAQQAVGSLTELEEAINLQEDLIKNYRPFFFSEPVDYGTPKDLLEPTGLNWFRSKKHYSVAWDGWSVDESQPIDVKFLCSRCDRKANPCYNGGTCDLVSRTCECPEYYVGSLCEHPVRCDVEPCLNNGTCSSWYGYCDCLSPFYGNLCQFVPVPTLLLP